MIRVILNGELIDQLDSAKSLPCKPEIGEAYPHQDKAYSIKSVCVDTRKGYCELTLDDEELPKKKSFHY